MNIPRRAHQCILKGEPFEEGCTYFSTLTQNGSILDRKDFCAACWQCVDQTHYDLKWQGEIPLKKKKHVTVDEKALKLLSTWIEEQEDSRLIYLLILYLVRRKQLLKIGAGCYEIIHSGTVIQFSIQPVPVEERAELFERLENELFK